MVWLLYNGENGEWNGMEMKNVLQRYKLANRNGWQEEAVYYDGDADSDCAE